MNNINSMSCQNNAGNSNNGNCMNNQNNCNGNCMNSANNMTGRNYINNMSCPNNSNGNNGMNNPCNMINPRNNSNNPPCQTSHMNNSSLQEQRGCSCNQIADKHILMKNIYELGFVLTEMNLYLDTHPDDMEAIEYYAQIKDKYRDYMTKYADYYGPLDKLHISNDNYWMWVATPMPWEMEGC